MKPSDYIAKGFCKNKIAEDKEGRYVLESNKKAVKWCTIGAILVAINKEKLREKFITMFANLPGVRGGITYYNDNPETTQEDVIKKLKKVERQLGIK